MHIPKQMLKNSSCGPETEIDGPRPSREYSVWTNISNALCLMKLSTMAPLLFLLTVSTVVANYVSKSSMINTAGGGSFPTFSLLFPEITNVGAKLTPGTTIIVLYWGFMSFCGIGGQ